DGVALLAELGELAGALHLELLDAHLEAPRRHRELGAQLILVGLDFRHRQRRGGLQPAHREADGAIMDERNDDKADQCGDSEANPEIQDRSNHETTSPSPPAPETPRKPSHGVTAPPKGLATLS